MQYLAKQIVAHAKCMFTLKSGWAPLNVELRNQQLVTCVTMGAIVGTIYLYYKRDKQIDGGNLALGAACGGLFGFACSVTWPAALVFGGTYVFCEGPKVFQEREKMTSYCGWASCNGKCGKNIRPNL